MLVIRSLRALLRGVHARITTRSQQSASSFRMPTFQTWQQWLGGHSRAGLGWKGNRPRLLVDRGIIKRSTFRIDFGSFGVKHAIFRLWKLGLPRDKSCS